MQFLREKRSFLSRGSISVAAAIALALFATLALAQEGNPFDRFDRWGKMACPVGWKIIGAECWKHCPAGQVAAAAGVNKCVKAPPRVEPIVDRGFFGGCPTGYVDHPADPARCVLPYVSARMLDRSR